MSEDQTKSEGARFSTFAAWVGLIAIVSALALPLMLDGYRWYRSLFDYFTFLAGAIAWKLASPVPHK